VIEENEPQRQSTACIQPQVTAISVDVSDRPLGSAWQMIGHDLMSPSIFGASAMWVSYRFGMQMSAPALPGDLRQNGIWLEM